MKTFFQIFKSLVSESILMVDNNNTDNNTNNNNNQ